MAGVSRLIQQLGSQGGLGMKPEMWVVVICFVIVVIWAFIMVVVKYQADYPMDMIVNASHYLNQSYNNQTSV